MIAAPTDARRELYGLQITCAKASMSYIDLIWLERDRENPSQPSAGKWPAQLGRPQKAVPPLTAATITQLKRTGR